MPETPETTEAFPWLEAWYAIHFVQDLDKTKPTRFVLLEQPIVIWWQPQQAAWVVLSDRCPHRLAPLSEGRINEQGCLECPYHGWSFTETGTCDRIPFQPQGGTAHRSDRATVHCYPSQVAQGILFVYPGNPENAATTPLPIIPALDAYPGEWTMADTFRDVPYDATTLLENVLDTSHVAFTHHPRVGNRANAKEFVLETSPVTTAGFTGFWQEGPRRGKLGSQKTNFCAPSLMWHDIEESPFGQVMTVVYATPIAKGKARALVRLPFRFKSKFPRLIFSLTPRWFGHLNQNSILEDDQIFLHLQERELAQADTKYAKACYVPTGSDRFVLAYRQWVETYGEPFPYTAFAPAEVNRELILERYQSHTQHCRSCQGALRRLQQLRTGCTIAIVLLWAVLPLAVMVALPLWSVELLAGLLLLSAGAWWQLGQLIQRFYEGEYPPSRNR